MEYIIRKKELKDCEDWINVNISSWNNNLERVVVFGTCGALDKSIDDLVKG